MDVVNGQCAGLDVHQKTVVAHTITTDAAGQLQRQTRTFGTTTAELLKLSDWLSAQGVVQVAMESTGEFWKPVYNLLEGNFTLLVVNAKHIKRVPGRKTDVQDAEWLAELLRHGLVQASFIPPLPQRDFRDLTRQRTLLVQERVRIVNRLQKVLEWANLKLTSVATDITGVSARAMLEAIVGGEVEGAVLAELAKGRMRSKVKELEQALNGRVREHHRFMMASHLSHLDFLDEQIEQYDTQISQHLQAQTPPTMPPAPQPPSGELTQPPAAPAVAQPALSWQEAVPLLDTIPGVGPRLAELLLAEIGSDMSRFPSADHLVSWAKVCPGNHQSGGKTYSAKTGQGSRWLRSALIQAAQAAAHTKDTFLGAVYRRLAKRRGKQKAIVALACRILRAVYHILFKHEPYHDLGPNHHDELRKEQVVNRLRHRIEKLGFTVTLEPTGPSV